jgi:N-formylglutamate deformylase
MVRLPGRTGYSLAVPSSSERGIWQGAEGDSPIIAVALHAGHALRPEITRLAATSALTRLKEEDPHTDRWTDLAATRLVACRSRFEVDLNRPRPAAVYTTPEDAWGMDLWRRPLPADAAARSLAVYDTFYATLEPMLARAEKQFGRFVVYDLHSYNHRRQGPGASEADPAMNPDVNIGTGSMDRERWARVVDRVIDDLRRAECLGRLLDVRENVRFHGGHLAAWVHQTFPRSGCALAIEVKKFFMDEHTGDADEEAIEAIGFALASTTSGVEEVILA